MSPTRELDPDLCQGRAMQRLLIAAALLVVGCSKSTTITTTNNNTINNITQRVGAMGARVESPGGAVADIPPGAVTVEVEVSIGEVASDGDQVPSLPPGETIRSEIFAFEPHGQTFAIPVTLTLPHNAGDDPVKILRASPNGAWQQLDISERFTGRVLAVTRSFSFYAVFDDASPADAGVTSPDSGGERTDAGVTSPDAGVEPCDPPAQCAPDLEVSACGGPLQGQWQFTDVCGLPEIINTVAAAANCPSVTVTASVTAVGTFTLVPDPGPEHGNYMIDLDSVGTGTASLPASCTSVFSCSMVESFIESMLPRDQMWDVNCSDSPDGGCTCGFLLTERINETGTYNIDPGESERVMLDGPSGDRLYVFSADDQVLTFKATSATPGMSTNAVTYFLEPVAE